MNLYGSTTISSVGGCGGTVTSSAGSSFPDIPVGICGLCAGKVTVPGIWTIPGIWGGAQSPIPTCMKCGATERPKPSCLPILEMDPRPSTAESPQTLLTTSTLKVLDLICEGPIGGTA